MALEPSDVNDGAILNQTIRESHPDKNNQVRCKITLPSGRDVVSEWMAEDALKGSILISWCDMVRDQVKQDSQKPKPPREPRPDSVEQEVKKGQVADSTDPLVYANEQKALYAGKVSELTEKLADMEVQLDAAERNLNGWAEIVDCLMGEETEGS